MTKRKMSYLDCILASTGYTLEYLKEHAVMDGKVIDHGEDGDCDCVDVADGNGDGLHFQCACSKWIRWAFPVRLIEEENDVNEVFFFGSTCINHWKVKCPDCKAIMPFEGVRQNTVDQCFRCMACDKTFFDRRRKEQKKERAKKKKPEYKDPEEQHFERFMTKETEEVSCHACLDTKISYWSDDVYGACLECCCIDCGELNAECTCRRREPTPPPPPTHRACVGCHMKNIPVEFPVHRIRCVPCYKAFMNRPKRLTM
jgi:DNA-directed RNA polymerase subunit M/transcription elongation factor TFIIS